MEESGRKSQRQKKESPHLALGRLLFVLLEVGLVERGMGAIDKGKGQI